MHPEHAEFITRNEVLIWLGISVSLFGIIVGILGKLLYGSIRGLIIEQKNTIMELTDKKINQVYSKMDKIRDDGDDEKDLLRKEAKEIRDNYLTRFEKMTEKLNNIEKMIIQQQNHPKG